MSGEELSINLLFPVLNERLRLQNGIDRTMAYLKENITIPYQLTILDNGSDDETPETGRKLEEKYPEVSYVRMEERGVGVAFRKGIALNESALVGYMDIDLSTDLKYLGKTIELFRTRPELAYVNGSRFSKESDTKGRKWYRKITSMGLVFLLKLFFHMKATDAVCGFTFLRKDTQKSFPRAPLRLYRLTELSDRLFRFRMRRYSTRYHKTISCCLCISKSSCALHRLILYSNALVYMDSLTH